MDIFNIFFYTKNKKIKQTLLIKLPNVYVFLALVVFLLQISFVLLTLLTNTTTLNAAETTPKTYFLPGYEGGGIGNYIEAIYVYAMSIIGTLAALVTMWGGLLWVTAGGNQQRIAEAKAWISASLSGLILAIASYLILNTISPTLTEKKDMESIVSSKTGTSNFGLNLNKLMPKIIPSTYKRVETATENNIQKKIKNECKTEDKTSCKDRIKLEELKKTEKSTKAANQEILKQVGNDCPSSTESIADCATRINREQQNKLAKAIENGQSYSATEEPCSEGCSAGFSCVDNRCIAHDPIRCCQKKTNCTFLNYGCDIACSMTTYSNCDDKWGGVNCPSSCD